MGEYLSRTLLTMGAGALIFALGAIFGASLHRRVRGDPTPLVKLDRREPKPERTS